jgi:enolase
MQLETSARKIKNIAWRRVLNSHLGFTNEFIIELDNGSVGIGASPQGETLSIFEDRITRSDAGGIVEEMRADRSLDRQVTQAELDSFLEGRMKRFGRNNCWALSLAFFNASQFPPSRLWGAEGIRDAGKFPRLCLNVINGGNHAYTNPVLSDFPEYLFVPRFDDVSRVIQDHAVIQKEIGHRLASCRRKAVNGNPVHCFETPANGECFRFLQEVLDRQGLGGDYDIWVDASAGDLWAEGGYHFSVTDGSVRSADELVGYWEDIINEFSLGFLEDPFREMDPQAWRSLTGGQSKCKVIGDNLYSTDPDRIESGACDHLTHGEIIKPNQAGTVTGVMRAVEVVKKYGQIAITSHRSISTESTFLSSLTVLGGVRYMKIGPLYTDYSSVLRLNELIRLTGVNIG